MPFKNRAAKKAKASKLHGNAQALIQEMQIDLDKVREIRADVARIEQEQSDPTLLKEAAAFRAMADAEIERLTKQIDKLSAGADSLVPWLAD
jgi:hypothetical protein